MCRLGCPWIILSDQGREFVNQLTTYLFEKTNTEHRITSAYHPQTNGLTERFNLTLCRSLVKFINESQDDWDQKLESILFGYRAAKHRTTGFSSFFMLYHREALLPIDVELMPNRRSECVEPIDDYIQAMLQVRDDLKPEAMRSIKRAQDYQEGSRLPKGVL